MGPGRISYYILDCFETGEQDTLKHQEGIWIFLFTWKGNQIFMSYWTAESRPMVWLISCLSQKNSQHHLLVVCLDRREDENLSPSVNEKPIMDWTVYIFLCSIKTQTKPCLVSFVRRGNVFRGQNRTKRILTDSYSARLILRNMPWKRKEL